MKDQISLDQLTPEQRKQLLDEALAGEKQASENRKAEVGAYNKMKYDKTTSLFVRLESISQMMIDAKAEIYSELSALLQMKNELYKVDEKQLSHSWTNEDGTVTIVTGFNTIDRWDESVSAGVTRVNMWLEKQLKDDNAVLVGMVRDLLKPNKDGVLKANRILDLQNKADSLGDTELLEAVKLIREAHRPQHSGTFIKAKYKDENDQWQWLPLSMSQA